MQTENDTSKKQEQSPWTFQIVKNYPEKPYLDTSQRPRQIGTFHVKIKEFGIDIRGVKYNVLNENVRIYIPSAKGVINGKPCKFPFLNFFDPKAQKLFIKTLTRCFEGFLYGKNYVPYEKYEEKTRRQKVRVFKDLPPRKDGGFVRRKRTNNPLYR